MVARLSADSCCTSPLLQTQLITATLLNSNPANGVMLDSCYHHCGDLWDTLHIDGYSQSAAFQQWYMTLGQQSARKVWRAGEPYPCAACCN
jgi:hypothetical protein